MQNTLKNGVITVGIAGALFGGGVVIDKSVNPYTEYAQKYEVILTNKVDEGQTKVELSKDKPEVTLSKWNGEVALKVGYNSVTGEGNRRILSDKVEWKDAKQEVHAYPLEPTIQMEGGGFEIEIYLKEKPKNNVFNFSVEGYKDLDFFYQPELTQDEINRGFFRSEDVVGSYAVYHKENKNYISGQTNYKTGKAYHIFRPKAIDADGNETWANLLYSEGNISVTVSEQWLEKASYPVTVDPTFGYTTCGASTAGSDGTLWGAQSLNSGSAGTVTKVSVCYLKGSASDAVAGLYSAGSSPTLIGQSVAFTLPIATKVFYDFPMTGSVSSATSYSVGYLTQNSSPTNAIYYDSGAATDFYRNKAETYSTTMPASPTFTQNFANFKISMYVTYTTASPSVGIPRVNFMQPGTVLNGKFILQ